MEKFYRTVDDRQEYWEYWDAGSNAYVLHWGTVGTKGETRDIKGSLLSRAKRVLEKEIERIRSQGFAPMDVEDHRTLLVEFKIDGQGTDSDLEKRHRLEARLNETLGWTGLGHCDGGSMGSGTMEACCYVVDFDLAKTVIENDLSETEFSDYSRIYDEDVGDEPCD